MPREKRGRRLFGSFRWFGGPLGERAPGSQREQKSQTKPEHPAVLTDIRADGRTTSFFGDLHGQGRDGVDFYTQKKVVIERWVSEQARKF